MTRPSPIELPRPLVEILERAAAVLVVTHIYPDGDALGSQLGLADILRALGKRVTVYGEAKAGHLYDFMPGAGGVETTLPDLARFDAAVALDCGDRFRLGRSMEQLLTVHPFLAVDHHSGHQPFGDHRWVDPDRSSTGEMVFELALALRAPISFEAAFNLYTAIVADTGAFKYESTSARTFQVAGALLDHGVKPAEVAGKLFDNYSIQRLRLLEAVLATLELHVEERIALISVTGEMFARCGATTDDTEDFINYPRALKTVKVAAFIKELPDGQIGVSMRAKGECDVAAVARSFGGGGHRNAAGFKTGSSVAQVRRELLAALSPLLAKTGG